MIPLDQDLLHDLAAENLLQPARDELVFRLRLGARFGHLRR